MISTYCVTFPSVESIQSQGQSKSSVDAAESQSSSDIPDVNPDQDTNPWVEGLKYEEPIGDDNPGEVGQVAGGQAGEVTGAQGGEVATGNGGQEEGVTDAVGADGVAEKNVIKVSPVNVRTKDSSHKIGHI